MSHIKLMPLSAPLFADHPEGKAHLVTAWYRLHPYSQLVSKLGIPVMFINIRV